MRKTHPGQDVYRVAFRVGRGVVAAVALAAVVVEPEPVAAAGQP